MTECSAFPRRKNCRPVRCPSFEEVQLQITAVCTCFETWPYMDPDCPVHGSLIDG